MSIEGARTSPEAKGGIGADLAFAHSLADVADEIGGPAFANGERAITTWNPTGHRSAPPTRRSTVREAVGPNVAVLVEMHRRLAPMHAIRIAAAIVEFESFWYERAVLAENLAALAEVRRGVSIPVVTGEDLYTGSSSGTSS